MVTITMPTPSTFFEAVWLGIGVTFGRSFGNVDHRIQQTAWFKQRHQAIKEFLKFLMNFLHHWWIGALIMIYAQQHQEAFWFGFGVLIDDLPDIPPRIRKLVGFMFNK